MPTINVPPAQVVVQRSALNRSIDQAPLQAAPQPARLDPLKPPNTPAAIVRPTLDSYPQPILSAYDELKGSIAQVKSLDLEWGSKETRRDQEFIFPYKHGPQQGQPIPKLLSDEQADGIAEDERETIDSYKSLRPQILKARQDAIAKMSLTPNAAIRDNDEFRQADSEAGRASRITELKETRRDKLRFSRMTSYLNNLLNKLGDF